MRFGLKKDHLDFFFRHRYIVFEDLVSEKEASELEFAMEEMLEKRMGKSSNSGRELYLAGRDGWREDPRIKKMTLRSTLAEIASELSKTRPLRIGYDQILCSSDKEEKIFERPLTLKQLSSIQGITCGLILTLSDIPSGDELLKTEDDVFILTPYPGKIGSGIFFFPNLPLCFDYLLEVPHTTQLLIVYTKETALYIHNPLDPHTHALKKLDYVFGDRLTSSTHPFVYQR